MESQTTPQETSIIASRLVEGRETLGLTKEDVSGHLAFDAGYLDELESGAAFPAALELRRLARLYRRNVAWILGEEADAPVDPALNAAVQELSENDKEKVLQFARFLAANEKAPNGS